MFGKMRMGRGYVTAAAGAFLVAVMGVSAQAQEAAGNCGCMAALPQSGQMVGQLVSASGTVNVLGANGWSQAAPGTPLFVGSRVETGADSNASLQFGNCALPMGEQSQVSLQPADGAVCVAVETTQPSFQYGQAPNTPPPNGGLPAALFIGSAGFIAGMEVATDDETRVSP